ncbi:MAG: hypothetical protein A3D44_02570 [Candidatus Staskawiczbacteria bacterium RIFCSPHIGHO2_02_FULL_42_22]|uniref:PrgI family protein n=1 Tax=Candidatus Staskawiczbacteria bacterium RIFCSPHIGHO2_02_FULL_42_22 TaxID=1802207 RepID=A0A1G2I3S9_9BACT|nr:MAG: hypothetical protein A3D44_02570 [Candidatus Staskawiczbacteria bacterium RIFCSPHIGHO2_02_FULL_42_22]
MAQYSTPQFTESEGKIISFLTFRQFFVLVGGGAVCFALYYTLPFALFLILGIMVATITAAIAFLKVNNTSVVTLVLHFITFSIASKTYVWKKKESVYPFASKRYEAKDMEVGGKTALDATKKIVEYRKK